jgi:hypothetical protein
VLQLTFLDVARNVRQTSGEIFDEALALLGRHEPEEIAGLGIVVGVVAMVVTRNKPLRKPVRSAYRIRRRSSQARLSAD